MSTLLAAAIVVTLACYSLAMALAVVRLLRGPGAQDRVLGLDFLYVNGMIVDLVVQHHLPAFVGYLVYIGEVVAPALLIVGLFTRAAAAIIVINMIFAVLLAHAGELFSMEKSGGYALELQALYLVTAIVVALIGAGRYSIGGLYGRWN